MVKMSGGPIKFIDGIADRLFAAFGAVALSQFPQFYGQYIQRLGGHLDEARRMLQQYIDAAASLELTLEEYIIEHLESGSSVFITSGEVIQGLLERYEALERAYTALQDANIYTRWFVFLREVDWSIAAGTWQNFMPGVPTTLEGLVYALTGLLVGWGIYSLFKYIVSLPFTGKVKRRGRDLSQRSRQH
ncbi:MAG: DUF2937 family protein [Firmicutes bacterium]|nr:DUF2937 family protein [Bacillota bacterium]